MLTSRAKENIFGRYNLFQRSPNNLIKFKPSESDPTHGGYSDEGDGVILAASGLQGFSVRVI